MAIDTQAYVRAGGHVPVPGERLALILDSGKAINEPTKAKVVSFREWLKLSNSSG